MNAIQAERTMPPQYWKIETDSTHHRNDSVVNKLIENEIQFCIRK